METINSIEKTRITFQFKLSSKTPLLPTYKAKLMQPSSLYTKMLAVIIGVKAARMSVMEKSNENLVKFTIVSIIHKGMESAKTIRKNLSGFLSCDVSVSITVAN